jgi:NADH-quinone oxidoreductase subunit C
MTEALQALADHLRNAFADAIAAEQLEHGELTIEVKRSELKRVAKRLRDDNMLRFEQLVDVCGVDYLAYGSEAEAGTSDPRRNPRPGARFAAVYHLLSVSRNQRLRVRVFLDDAMPVVDSVTDLWSSANWYEREAFDLFGIVFEGHPDLRRLLTDYGFIGHPFRKDFPLSGHVEMRYDPAQGRVVYQPVSIDPRINVPRVIREEGFGRRES